MKPSLHPEDVYTSCICVLTRHSWKVIMLLLYIDIYTNLPAIQNERKSTQIT